VSCSELARRMGVVSRAGSARFCIEFAGGTSRFPLPAVYGSAVTSVQLDQPPNIVAYQRFMPQFAAEFSDLQTRPVTHVVDAPAMVTPAAEIVPMAGYTPSNLERCEPDGRSGRFS
jgi:hypothetical protein